MCKYWVLVVKVAVVVELWETLNWVLGQITWFKCGKLPTHCWDQIILA